MSRYAVILCLLSIFPGGLCRPTDLIHRRQTHKKHLAQPAKTAGASSTPPRAVASTTTASTSPSQASSWTDTWWTPSTFSTVWWTPSPDSTVVAATTSPSSIPAPSPSSEPASSPVDVTQPSFSPAATKSSRPTTSTASISQPSTAPSGGSGSGPHWVAYYDSWVSGEIGPPDVSAVQGFNTFILSFLLGSGSVDQAEEWASLNKATQGTIKAAYNAAGIKLMVSAFGSTETPTSSGYDAVDTANTMAQWVIANQLDGIDVDYEDFAAINAGDGKAEAWLISFTQTLRSALPAGQYIITHAPVAPWFSAAHYPAGAYSKVNSEVGSLIDWYNIQFYNQGVNEYIDCNGLLTESSSASPNSAVFQIAAGGVDLNKIVIGKPGTTADANNGYIDPATLATCVTQAQAQGWNAGVMTWEFHGDNSWITTVQGGS